MNKIKLGVGLILIVLCVAVLGIGIYAAASSTSTITGTITVNSACPEVKISAYQDSYNPASPSTNMLGTPIEKRNGSGTISLGTFSMNEDEVYKSIYAEPVIPIIIVVENHSFDQELGVYFWKDANNGGDGTIDKNTNSSDPEYGCVLYSDILYGHHTYGSGNVIDIEYEFYKMVPCATDVNSNGVFNSGTDTPGREVIRMYLRMNAIPDQQVVFNFNVNLNIENYVSNYTSTSANQKTFTKVGVLDLYYYNNGFYLPSVWASGTIYVTLPFTLNYAGWATGLESTSKFSTGLLAVSFPKCSNVYMYTCCNCVSLTSVFLPYYGIELGSTKGDMVWGYAFKNCTSLRTIVFENTIGGIGNYAFWGCTGLVSVTLNDTTWTTTGGPSGLGVNAFRDCTGLIEIYIYETGSLRSSNLASASAGYFYGCSSSLKIHIPTSRASDHTSYYGGTYWCYYDDTHAYTPIADL